MNKFDRKGSNEMRVTVGEYFSFIYIGFMFIVGVSLLNTGNDFNAIVAFAGVLCGLAPLLFQWKWKTKFETSLMVSYILFCFGSQYLGSIRKWYSLGYWDMLMHLIAGILLGFIGVRVLQAITKETVLSQLSGQHVFWFVKGFGVFWGAVWEVYEFTGDQLFGTTMQGNGNTDTMTDLICDLVGSMLVAIWYKKKHMKKYDLNK